MPHLGDFTKGQTITYEFSTTAFDDGTMTDLTSETFEIYKDGGNTQFSTGITATTPADTTTGFNRLVIVTTDATYTRGSFYSVVLTAGTVDSVSVAGTVVCTFTIEACHESGRIITAATSQGVGVAQMTLASGTITAYGTLLGATLKELDSGQERTIITENSGTDVVGVDANWNPALTGTPRYHVYAGSPAALDPIPADIIEINSSTTNLATFATWLSDSALEAAAGVPNTDISVLQGLRLILSACAAKAAKSGDNTVFRDIQDTVNRLTTTATDAAGRTALTLGDLTN